MREGGHPQESSRPRSLPLFSKGLLQILLRFAEMLLDFRDLPFRLRIPRPSQEFQHFQVRLLPLNRVLQGGYPSALPPSLLRHLLLENLLLLEELLDELFQVLLEVVTISRAGPDEELGDEFPALDVYAHPC